MKALVPAVVALATLTFVSASLLGGRRRLDVDKNKDEIAIYARKAEEVLKEYSNGQTFHLGNVKSAEVKIIAGAQYFLTVDVSGGGIENRECAIVVTFRADRNEWSVSSDPESTCHDFLPTAQSHSVVVNRNKRSAGGLLGGQETFSVDDLGVQEAAKWAVNHLNQVRNSLFRIVLEKIADGSRQVVNGYKYRFLLYLVSTNCRNNAHNSDKGLEECPVGDSSERLQCDATVLYSGMKYSMLDFNCKALKPLMGGDDHDYKIHGQGKNLMGGDDHDYKIHGQGKNLMGGDDHDYKIHGQGKRLMGGDDHDYKIHGQGKNLMGGDDHDYKIHGQGKNLMGGDDHDYKIHDKNPKNHLLGRDWHDYIHHINYAKQLINEAKGNVMRLGKDVLKKNGVLGGDSHDYQSHGGDPCVEYRGGFEQFKSKHGRLYASQHVEEEKFQIFCGNMEKVKEYQKQDKGSANYGATEFADISEKEFKAKYLGFKMNEDSVGKWPSAEIPTGPTPSAWDWREHNAVTPVKNQGTCGSCWAFSTTGNIEGRNAIKNKKLVSLSEQELVDCDKIDEGCNGGLPIQAYEAIMKLGGIEPEKDYSYDGADEKCKFDKSEVAVKVTGALNISKNEGGREFFHHFKILES